MISFARQQLSLPETYGWNREAFTFILDWVGGRGSFSVSTSGSTGTPKLLSFPRETMIASARRSLSAFGLQPGQSCLMALPIDTIAGMMLLVRALEGGLNLLLHPPQQISLRGFGQIDFAALLPVQVERLLGQNEDVSQIRKMIIGGASMNTSLRGRLVASYTGEAWETYGMTETLTHVAIRKVMPGNQDSCYEALPGVHFSMDERSCLVIHDSITGIDGLTTNDVVELDSSTEFRLTGRYDFIINSGGIKINPEEVERVLQERIGLDFCISSRPDARLGERIVLVVAGSPDPEWQSWIGERIDRYRQPKETVTVEAIPRNRNGKIDRPAVRRMLLIRAEGR